MTKHNTKRYEILAEIRKNPMASIRELGKAMGIASTGTIIHLASETHVSEAASSGLTPPWLVLSLAMACLRASEIQAGHQRNN